jgi:hypothetical protein
MDLTDEIRQRAHQIWAERAARDVPGTAESDWAQAEEKLGIDRAGGSYLFLQAHPTGVEVAAEISAEHQDGPPLIGIGHKPPEE